MELCSKVVKCSEIFLKKTYFFGKCLFSPWFFWCDKFHTSPRRLYCLCDDFYKKKYLVNLYRIHFWELLKILIIIILKMLDKLCLVNIFKFDQKHVNYQKPKNITRSMKKKASMIFFVLLIIYNLWVKLEKVYKRLTFPE